MYFCRPQHSNIVESGCGERMVKQTGHVGAREGSDAAEWKSRDEVDRSEQWILFQKLVISTDNDWRAEFCVNWQNARNGRHMSFELRDGVRLRWGKPMRCHSAK